MAVQPGAAVGGADRPPEVDRDEIVELAMQLLAAPSPAGAEGPLAADVAVWLRARTEVRVELQAVADGALDGEPSGPGSANVLVGSPDGPALAFYGHLDTSLSGVASLDAPLVARTDGVPPPALVDGVLWGHGAAVAKAPTAAALVTLVALHRALGSDAAHVGALVAAGGTHRALPPWPSRTDGGRARAMGAGVRAAIDAGFRPRAVIVAKGGAPGPLHEEPGMVYLSVTVRDRYRPSLVEPRAAAFAGTAAAAIAVAAAAERWRRRHLADADSRSTDSRSTDSQVAADVVLGAVAVGAPAKPDVHADHARLHLHVVTVPGGHDPDGIARALAAALHVDADLVTLGLADRVDVAVYGDLPAGRTDPDHAVVRAARDAWAYHHAGPAPEVRDWRGTTDGALLRSLGVPTVRVGPPLLTHPDDPRIEGVRVDDLVRCAAMWAAIAWRVLGRAEARHG